MNNPSNLQQVLERIRYAAMHEQPVTFGAILDTVGSRSYGPVLMVVGILLMTPISAIPGVPTLNGLLILFISVQMMVMSEGFWIPGWLTKRHLPSGKLLKGIDFLEPAACFIDARLHARLVPVVRGPGSYLIGGVCIALAIAMPLMEVIPFSASAAGFALTVFGLALISMDGLLAVLGLLFTTTIVGIVVVNVL